MTTSKWMRSLILAGGAALVAALCISAACDAWRLHQQVLAGNEREIRNLARALADETTRTLQSVDVLLLDTATWYEANGASLKPAAVVAALAARTVGVPQVSAMTIVDADGRQLYRSNEGGAPLADVSDRPYFQAQRARGDAGLYISDPLITRGNRNAGLVMSRRLSAAGASFAGVVTAVVTLQRLKGMFSAIDLGEGSALLLALGDGTLVVRQPEVPGVVGVLRFPELAEFKRGGSIHRAVSPMDGRTKFVAAVGVDGTALTLAITRDEEVALRPSNDAIWGTTTRTGLMSLTVALAVFAILRQLRRQEEGERALRQSEERYAMAMDAANEGHSEWNIRENTVFASARWRSLHGVDMNQSWVTTDEFLKLFNIHPDDQTRVQFTIEQHLAGRSSAIEIEYRVRLAENEWRWIHARGRCSFDPTGAPLRLFSAAFDVSERMAAEANKAEFESRLQQARRLEALGTLAGGIAHDFNNILGAILGFGQMAQQHASAGSAIRRHIDRVLQAGERARLLVRRILEFSRSGVAVQTQVNFQAVVEEVMAMLRLSLSSDLQLNAQLEAGNISVLASETQLHQVVMNLCTNAIQAVGEDGKVQVILSEVRLADAHRVLHGVLSARPYLRLIVEDNGMGIAPDVLARMFDPFFTTKKIGEGTGLGLSVVHGIVTDLDGAIDVTACDGGGTAVSIWLPVAGRLTAVQSDDVSVEWARGCGEVVLIVDDESPLVELAEELLADLGYEPVGFSSAEKAWRAFEEDPERFDAVLADDTMPGMSGTDLVVKMLERRPELPTFLMSGNISQGLEQRALQARATLLAKPLVLNELASSLAHALQSRKQ